MLKKICGGGGGDVEETKMNGATIKSIVDSLEAQQLYFFACSSKRRFQKDIGG